MARWKLMTSHYLNTVIPTEWEYQETDRKTGRPKRTRFHVPALLDPNDPGCWTNKWGNKDNEEGECIVCHAGKGESGDIEFLGDPTPDMQPVDDEAREISASFEEHWKYKPDSAEQSYSQSLVDQFRSDLIDAQAKPVEIPGLADLASAVAQIAASNQLLIEKLAAQPKAKF